MDAIALFSDRAIALSRGLLLIHKAISRAYTILQSPLAPLFKGGNSIKVPLKKGDLGGSIAT
jgi:hypothetical protein